MGDRKIYKDHSFAVYQNVEDQLSFYRIVNPNDYKLINKTTFNELCRLMAELSEKGV